VVALGGKRNRLGEKKKKKRNGEGSLLGRRKRFCFRSGDKKGKTVIGGGNRTEPLSGGGQRVSGRKQPAHRETIFIWGEGEKNPKSKLGGV